ncbi:hypothetical protein [Butyrivibrio sp. XPD2006]|uniref:hypothetical protein n=1 Tax=Butyrivibrio sp. XPD2006 TaxID=1280668 RepID=UPI0003B31EDB|nr:hypothetical protein [Butyrivibrio sp. XPD2006]
MQKLLNNRIKILAIILVIILIATLLPIIYVSKFAYPWADDFGYSADARQAFLRTGSVFATLGPAFEHVINTYFTWQGTYTSCFFMALEPAVFGIKLYHLGGSIMLLSILLSYYYLLSVVFNKLFNASGAVKWCLLSLLTMYTIQGVDGKAEAFTWFNSAVHYTFAHSLLILFIALTVNHIWTSDNKKRIVRTVLISILGFLAAGTNNITVFGGLLFIVLFYAGLVLYQRVYGDRTYDKFLRSLPMIISFFVGAAINLGAPGNKQRMLLGSNNNNLFVVVKNSFALGSAFIQRHFSGVTLGFILLTAAIIWYSNSADKLFEKATFKFPLPVLVTVISFCLLSALYAPFAYLGDAEISEPYIDANLSVTRVSNTIFFAFVLLLFFNVFYYCGWLHNKGFNKYSPVAGIALTVAAIIIIACSTVQILGQKPGAYTTASAINNIKNGTAAYYGLQMSENINKLQSDDAVVYVSPIAVDPDCLYPHEAEDWKSGTKYFFDKEEVIYDAEPYDF